MSYIHNKIDENNSIFLLDILTGKKKKKNKIMIFFLQCVINLD